MTFTFEAMPRGVTVPVATYSESGMQFWNPYGPENLVLAGGGVSSRPDNGTGYLQVSSGAMLAFSFNTFPSTYFNLLSFDAAEYDTAFPGPVTLEVVGYRPMAGTVTNFFTLDGINDGTGLLQDFQTFNLDSRFVNLYRVDFLTDRFSLDNVVIGGVPEPPVGGLVLAAALCLVSMYRFRRARRAQRPAT
jgi:hypothetical protein